jgi:hypothetical protein
MEKTKQQVVAQIKEKLTALGLTARDGSDTDITLDTTFLDAAWSTGSKRIGYEAAILADEGKQTVFMYEKTTESAQGLALGMESASSRQSGSTLYRKVKSTGYGPDGKAYEYDLDLGAIPGAAKETAQRLGWKFKTVLSRKKASYPAGK